MKKNIPVIITLLSVAVAAGGISFGVRANNQKHLAEQEAQALRARQALPAGPNEIAAVAESGKEPLVSLKANEADTNSDADTQALIDAQAAELERLRAELAGRQNRPPRESFQDRMDRMKEEEPERYAEMVQNRTERQEQMRYDQANRLATFVDMDTGNMTPEELENHNLLVEKLSGIWEQTAAFDPEQPPDRETMRAVFDTIREVRPLMEQERTVMLKQLGSEVGLTGNESEDFATYVQDIYSATSLRMPGGGPRGGGRNGGGANAGQ